MHNKEQLGDLIREACTLEGDFLLRSGVRSRTYFDKYQAISNPSLLGSIAYGMSELVPPETDLLAGLELGGAMLATAISLESGIDTVIVRKKAKEYGTAKLIEGPSIGGMRLCIVEDVITSGGAVFAGVEALREAGAIVEDVVCMILRDLSVRDKMSAHCLRLQALFEWETK